ncbi:MAG: insulinase family protein [Bacteroidaceae bacterium]|nr:insulinase family protein [Bacteroidaceae bacterium]
MKKLKTLIYCAAAMMFVACNNSKYNYETVENDPMGVKIYTLKNGLKVYMSVNKQTPRIQTYIGVRAGSKNEPEESTGLAHYLEHVMFKGSESFGTTDYAKEKPMLDEIERLYEVYRATTDPAERKAIYHTIDSISYEASKLAIPNEYDKLMATIGSEGSNAFTSYDVTAYVEDIPSNQIENWAKVQADRFKHLVIRGFHTELEAVYEEYNGGLTEDWDKMHDTIATVLFPSHTYKRGIIGKQEHLKSPSITNIKKFFKTYYVPNNMAICVAGDFEPDSMVAVIERYFGDMEPNENLPKFEYKKDPELKAAVTKTVLSPQEEYVTLAWRFDGAATMQMDTLSLVSDVLYNGKAGLLDLNLNLKQKVLQAYARVDDATDYSTLQITAYPMPGQSLDELKNIILNEVKNLRKGKFAENIVKSAINREKLEEEMGLEKNNARAMNMLGAFISGADWKDVVNGISRKEKIAKTNIVDFANKHLRSDNYVAIYKRKGTDPAIVPVEKPSITPIVMNRDVTSDFVKEVSNATVTPIEPVFIDLSKDITKAETSTKLPMVYVKNDVNKIFRLQYVYEMGAYADPTLDIASEYLAYLGTDSLSAEKLQEAFYSLGCEYSIKVADKRTTVTISGLDENMQDAMALYEHVIGNIRPDAEAWQKCKMSIAQLRMMQISDFASYMGKLNLYLTFGPEYLKTQNLSNERIESLTPESLVESIKAFRNYSHEVTYYGPRSLDDVKELVEAKHYAPSKYVAVLPNHEWNMILPKEGKVVYVPFDETMNFDFAHYTSEGIKFDADLYPVSRLYTEYLGGGMNSIVFQDMREKKALVYGASAGVRTPNASYPYFYFRSYAESQSDKLGEVISTFGSIINDMPEVQNSFDVVKNGVIARLRTSRTTGKALIDYYYWARDLGIDYDTSKLYYDKVQNLTLKDVVAYQQKYVKNKPFHYAVVGKKSALDFAQLRALGTVEELTAEQLFGY